MENKLEELLESGPVVINVGVRGFAESIQAQEMKVEVVHIDWTPPAGGDKETAALLDKLL
jgi:FdrA protein